MRAERCAHADDESGRREELREAHRLYDAMGAAAHAERIVGELAP